MWKKRYLKALSEFKTPITLMPVSLKTEEGFFKLIKNTFRIRLLIL